MKLLIPGGEPSGWPEAIAAYHCEHELVRLGLGIGEHGLQEIRRYRQAIHPELGLEGGDPHAHHVDDGETRALDRLQNGLEGEEVQMGLVEKAPGIVVEPALQQGEPNGSVTDVGQ